MVGSLIEPGRPTSAKLTTPLILGLIVFAAALFGIMTRLSGHLSFFWIANAVLLGVMVRQPAFVKPACWVAAGLGFVAADILTGSPWSKSFLLTTANMAGVYAGILMYRWIGCRARMFKNPTCMWHLIGIAAAASAAAAFSGITLSVLRFDPIYGSLPLTYGALLWFVTEFTNYIVVLPLMLALPDRILAREWVRKLRGTRWTFKDVSPVAAYFLCLLLMPLIEGPGLLAFPLPALLWCAVVYSVVTTEYLTFAFAVLVLLFVSVELVGIHFYADSSLNILSLRLGVALASLAPLMVSIVMASRNEALRMAASAQAIAEDAMASRSLLLATMAHELRSPLNAISGYAGLMSQQMRGQLSDRRYVEDAKSIELASQHLATLVTDLLDTAKIEAGQIDLEMAEVSSAATVEQAIRLIRGVALEKQIKIVQAEGDWPPILADDRAIKQVLINLVANAVKFSNVGDTINIVGQTVGNRLIIEVIDTGSGMSAAELERLGQAYRQAGDREGQRQGTGLGLALSRHLIEQHGGKLRLTSAVGIGTTAAFDLPSVTSV